MTEEEKAILLEIDTLYSLLLQEPNDKWIGRYVQKPSGYSYSFNARKLRDKVWDLYNRFKPDYISEQDILAIDHTCDKEVSYVEFDYNQSIKSNAAKKRHTEFIESISKANRQIRLDILSVIKKIEEIKKKEE